ncbi:dTDP-4-dehydrorhamnose 3,5-epimerase family protein [Niabella sp. W65]|nr:dTDP-4-dehydrorhamnose 3,5-epimerase family protein [Niabella sp. W65]MCH7366627.1 dTDP-4-dehydrorhamnose 3,5-epimerase family protein [Niabella sp. W65]ULT42339.1 dTDP-4-dehydrorhamnose 3,5-epimerase family protein [Niabella sp. I65]
MPFTATPLEGLLIFEPRVFEDSRGYFFEAYNKSIFEAEGLQYNFVQDNQSFSSYGVVRGYITSKIRTHNVNWFVPSRGEYWMLRWISVSNRPPMARYFQLS